MNSALFLQSEVADPYEMYSRMLKENPVCWDPTHRLWTVYPYHECQFLLNSPAAEIPDQPLAVKARMGGYATRIAASLTRLSNPPRHSILSQATIRLFEKMEPVGMAILLEELMGISNGQVDWVRTVGKQLPALAILKGFDFPPEAIDYLLPQIGKLTKIMLSNPTEEQILAINEAAATVYPLIERRVLEKKSLRSLLEAHLGGEEDGDKILSLYAGNLIGLLIQSYDAGRGVLSNSLLQLLIRGSSGRINGLDRRYFQQSVMEALRYDSPVHHTRRVMTEDGLYTVRKSKKEKLSCSYWQQPTGIQGNLNQPTSMISSEAITQNSSPSAREVISVWRNTFQYKWEWKPYSGYL